ncbi:MAG: glycosyltransferase family 2 protein [Hyphomicrobiales bacterium]|nr:glycosyltransferase family 2 protein [Hyphomicrobiales bacterium]
MNACKADVAPIPKAVPFVSVVMIFLNGEPFIQEAIDSVLGQTFQNFELILVDDGSTDESSQRCARLAELSQGRIFYLEHDGHQNRGMSASRNLGIRAARGQIIALIDSDDFWRPNKLSEQLAILQRFPEVDMVCGAVNYWSSWRGGTDEIVVTGHVHDMPIKPPEASLALYPLGKACSPCPSDLLLRRQAVFDVGLFEEHFTGPYSLYEDQGFLSKLYVSSTVFFSSRIWLDYRIHENSCVAVVHRDGQYQKVRNYFLNWSARYLKTIDTHPARSVAKETARAAFYSNYSWFFQTIWRPIEVLKKVLRRAKKASQRFVRTAGE